jgi:hypothetical protein
MQLIKTASNSNLSTTKKERKKKKPASTNLPSKYPEAFPEGPVHIVTNTDTILDFYAGVQKTCSSFSDK